MTTNTAVSQQSPQQVDLLTPQAALERMQRIVMKLDPSVETSNEHCILLTYNSKEEKFSFTAWNCEPTLSANMLGVALSTVSSSKPSDELTQ